MKNDKYWKKRFSQLEAAQNKMGTDAYMEIENIYRQAQKTIEGQISSWYQRFADNNHITLAEARQYLKGSDLTEFKWTVNDYIKYGEQNAEYDGLWAKELENASAKFHISKLEELKMEVQNSLETVFSEESQIATSTLADVYESGYYHTAYELQKGFNIGFDIASINQSEIEKVLSKPWAVDGYNFSERIWDNKDKLISTIHNELTQNIMLGKDPQVAINAIAKQMNTSKNNAGRLVMTEEAYFSSLAQQDCFKDLGVKDYEILATLDSHTSDICREMDGKVFPMAEFEAGVTAPPFHPWCRSTTIPHFDDNFGQIGERAARDENGQLYYVPDDMNYQDWKTTFVDGGDKSDFAVYDENGVLHYKKNEPEEAPKEKKEYLTENKLKQKIADDDVKIDELKEQANQIFDSHPDWAGYTYDEFMGDGDFTALPDAYNYVIAEEQKNEILEKYDAANWSELADLCSDQDDLHAFITANNASIEAKKALSEAGVDLSIYGSPDDIKNYYEQIQGVYDIQNQIQAVEAEKADYQAKLEEKQVKKEKKNLTKQEMKLEEQKADLQKQLDEFDVKTYSGIWKNDVTTADYKNLNIEGKKEYYQKGIETGKAGDQIDKYYEYLEELDELEKEGASYQEIQDKIDEIQSQIEDIENRLTKLDTQGMMALSDEDFDIDNPFSEDAYSEEREKNAYWFTDANGSVRGADKVLRSGTAEVWNDPNTPEAEKDAAYDYTVSYSKFNEPLRGIEYGTNIHKGMGNIDLDMIGVNGYGGYKKGQVHEEINNLTNFISKSTLKQDMWFQRGCSLNNMDLFFNCDSSLFYKSESEIAKALVGNTYTEGAFMSAGVAKGKGLNSSGGIVFNIYAPKGTQGMYLEPFSAYGVGVNGKYGMNGYDGRNWDGVTQQTEFGQEAEILFQQGSELRVTQVKKSYGTIYIDVEIVGQNPQR